jgi:hypothetical protein
MIELAVLQTASARRANTAGSVTALAVVTVDGGEATGVVAVRAAATVEVAGRAVVVVVEVVLDAPPQELISRPITATTSHVAIARSKGCTAQQTNDATPVVKASL